MSSRCTWPISDCPTRSDGRRGNPFPIVAHAVTHQDGVFLFDTGLGTGNAEIDAMFSPERYPLEDALAAHGIAFADVTALANSTARRRSRRMCV